MYVAVTGGEPRELKAESKASAAVRLEEVAPVGASGAS